MKKTKRLLTMMIAMLMAGSMSMNALADVTYYAQKLSEENEWVGWHESLIGMWWRNADGTHPEDEWVWIDEEPHDRFNTDGVYKCYYFDSYGVMAYNRTTPDGYTVNGNGEWIVDGVVQTQGESTNAATGNSNKFSFGPLENKGTYDPAHPLANVIDAWNLRIVPPSIEVPGGRNWSYAIGTRLNVHALLTNQMDQYYMNPAGWSVNPVTGTRVYTEQSDIDRSLQEEQALYNWFCNWLNGMDFQNMSEMDRAKEIKKVLGQARYDTNSSHGTYGILIEKAGVCSDFAAAAISMAKALGLKCASAPEPQNHHERYYIWVDGVRYRGDNQSLNLDAPALPHDHASVVPMDYFWD